VQQQDALAERVVAERARGAERLTAPRQQVGVALAGEVGEPAGRLWSEDGAGHGRAGGGQRDKLAPEVPADSATLPAQGDDDHRLVGVAADRRGEPGHRLRALGGLAPLAIRLLPGAGLGSDPGTGLGLLTLRLGTLAAFRLLASACLRLHGGARLLGRPFEQEGVGLWQEPCLLRAARALPSGDGGAGGRAVVPVHRGAGGEEAKLQQQRLQADVAFERPFRLLPRDGR
jgi:hypothetical protein